jgi:NAD(P) transhydrogenase subunit alpha
MTVRLGVLGDKEGGERRVALVPDAVTALTGRGVEVVVEAGAGVRAGFADEVYVAAGAGIVSRAEAGAAAVVVGVQGTSASEDGGVASPGSVHIALFDALWDPSVAERLAAAGVSALSLDLVPRITRAQTMDVLSSMATIAGYEAALLAASRLPRLFPMMMTAAGTLTPARVLVIGAGVAGLQAIATARRLGAVVEGYDIRPAAAEQIRSVGARSIELEPAQGPAEQGAGGDGAEDAGGYARAQSTEAEARQRDLLARHVAAADVVITTAAVPGRRAPLLLTTPMIEAMAPGSVVVDLAAERGGNTEVTRADEEVMVDGVTVLGPTDLASRAPVHASQMYSTNVTALLEHLMTPGGADDATEGEAPRPSVVVDPEDEITAAMLVTHRSAVVHPAVREQLSQGAASARAGEKG